MLATAHLQWGTAEEGLHVVAEAAALVRENAEPMWEAELKRVEGELRRIQSGSLADIEAYFEQAVAIARAQGAKSLELRATSSLARLWRDHGRSIEARLRLEAVYQWFTEGFDTPDLMDTRTILESLG